ncbi:MAG: DUF3343 domain-containing protein [Synergistaceae bacterium]|jgi:hypothetical protein|nr:DUF3343 domain-containing protein [Synergistaceae bacterium]
MEAGRIWYVLFPNHTQGLLLDRLLGDAGIRATIVPTPRALSKSCGMALRVGEESLPAVRLVAEGNKIEILDIASLPDDINPGRDKYC